MPLPITIRFTRQETSHSWNFNGSNFQAGGSTYDLYDFTGKTNVPAEDIITDIAYQAILTTNGLRADDTHFIAIGFANLFIFDTDFNFYSVSNVPFNDTIETNSHITITTSTAVVVYDEDGFTDMTPGSYGMNITDTAFTEISGLAAGSYIDVRIELNQTVLNGGIGAGVFGGEGEVAVVPPSAVRPVGIESLAVGGESALSIVRVPEVRIGGHTRQNVETYTLPYQGSMNNRFFWELQNIRIVLIRDGFRMNILTANFLRANPLMRFEIIHPTTGIVFDGLLGYFQEVAIVDITEAEYNAIYGPSTDINNLDDRIITFYLPDTTETPDAAISIASALTITPVTAVRLAGIASTPIDGASYLDISSILNQLPITVSLAHNAANSWLSDPDTTEQRLFKGQASNRSIGVTIVSTNTLRISITGGVDFDDDVEDSNVLFAIYVGRTFIIFRDVTGASHENNHPYDYTLTASERAAFTAANTNENTIAMVFSRPDPVYISGQIPEEVLSLDTSLSLLRPTAVRLEGIATQNFGGASDIDITRVSPVRLTGIGVAQIIGDAMVNAVEPTPVRIEGIGTAELAGLATSLVVEPPGAIRISGIASTDFAGSSALNVENPTAIRIAGIGSVEVSGESALFVEASDIPIPNVITTGVGEITFGDYRLQWSDGFRETYRFRTSIIEHQSGVEQRIANRFNPRVDYEFTAFLDEIEMRSFLARVVKDQGRLDYMPHPRDLVSAPVDINPGTNYVGFDPVPVWLIAGSRIFTKFGLHIIPGIVLGTDPNGALLVFSNSSTIPRGTPIYRGIPVRPGTPPNISALTSRVGTMSLRAEGDPVANWLPPFEEQPPAVLANKEYFDLRVNWNGGLQVGIPDTWENIDFNRGAVDRTFPRLFPTRLFRYNFTIYKETHFNHLYGLFRRCRGRQKSFYMPSHMHEIIPMGRIRRSRMTVAGRSFVETFQDSVVFKHIRILHKVGQYIAEIDTIEEDADGNSLLTFVSRLPTSLDPEEVLMISWINLVRLESDALTIDWLTDGVAQVTINVRSLETEVPT